MSHTLQTTNKKVVHHIDDVEDTFIEFTNTELKFSGDIVPDGDETFNLGNQNNYFEKIFVKEVQASNNSFTFGEEFKISKNGGEIGFLKVRNKNKLPPLITNFRDALLENGVFFLQKRKTVIKNGKATNKVVNFIKLLEDPDTYISSTHARDDTPNKLIEILDAVVLRNPDRFVIGSNPAPNFRTVWDEFKNSDGANWNLGGGEILDLGERGKTETYTNNVDEIEFSLLTLQEIELFITNDVQNAVNKKKKGNTFNDVNAELITFDSGFNTDYRFNMKGEIIGQFDLDENKFVTGDAVDIFAEGTSFAHNALAFTGYSQSNTYDAFGAAADQGGALTNLSEVTDILDFGNEGNREFIVPVGTEYESNISSRVDFLNNNTHLLALKKANWPYAEEIPIVKVEDNGSNKLKITIKFGAYLLGESTKSIALTNLYFDLRPEIVMGYDQSFNTAAATTSYFEPLMNDTDGLLQSTIQTEINVTITNFNNKVVFLPMHVAAMSNTLNGSYLQLKAMKTDGTELLFTGTDGIEIAHHIFSNGSNIVVLVAPFDLDDPLTTDPLTRSDYMFVEFKIVSSEGFNNATSTNTGAAITGTATMEDYYDKTTNTQDPFMAGFSQQITSHITDPGFTGSAATFGNFTESWNSDGDNSTVDKYRGNDISTNATGLTSLTSNSKILENQVSAGQFDASELLAYNDEDYFIKYSMITKNKYASYTDDNFLIGFKDEPNKEPYCKLTVKGSIKNTKSIVVTDAKYNDSDFMNTMKNTLADGTVFTEGLIVSNRRSDVNNRESNGLYCRGDITTAGNFTADTIEATSKIKVGSFELNANGVGIGGTLTLSSSLRASTANISGALTCGEFTLSSDRRLKENIVDLHDETVDHLRPVKFNWKNKNDDRDVFGVIAQEVEKVYPDTTNKTGEFMKVDYIQFIPILIKEVQDLKKMNKILMAKIDLLEKN